jgi:hypothetical protein
VCGGAEKGEVSCFIGATLHPRRREVDSMLSPKQRFFFFADGGTNKCL